MSKIKKLIALALALAMALSVSAFAGYTVDTYADAADINADCKSAIELMYALDIMKGNENGEFMPEKPVTRAEMAKMIYVILNYGNDDKAVTYTGGKFFTDVAYGYWAEGYINYCASTNLIAGRGDGTFDPTAAVTTAEAAKMLLTAIGYSAEARGYTGANWDKNVLNDAAILGLLDGYKSNVSAAAPRQWVAVLVENALDCWTYTTMYPGFSGLITSGEDRGYVEMGYKYYGMDSFSAVAYATEDAYIDQIVVCEDEDHEDAEDHGEDCYTYAASEDTVLFANGLEIEETGLKVADLGQKYKVIYNVKDMTAYSVRSLGATGEARIYEMDVDVKHATSGNKPNNKYVFTVGEMEATLQGGEVKYLTSDNYHATVNAESLYESIEAADKYAYDFKAIDSENDGDIDYLYIITYQYGYVNEVATSNKYGKYINVAALSTEEDAEPLMLEYAEGDNLYLKDCVITADEFEEDNIVKYSWSLDAGKWVIEVLPAVKGVEYKAYDDKNDIFVLGSKEYYVAETENDYDYEDEILDVLVDEDNLGDEYNAVYDGDLIVFLWQDDDRFDTIDEVNEQLVLVLDAENDYSDGSLRECNAIEYMTIDGKTHIAKYIDKDTDANKDDVLDYVQFSEIEHLETVANLEDDEMSYTVEGRLFKLYTTSKGVYLEKLDNAGINEQLNVKETVLTNYGENGEYYFKAKGSTTTIDNYKVAVDNKYFVGSYDDGEPVYTVMTLKELRNCYDDETYGQILTYTNEKGTRTTVVGGYLFLDLSADDNAAFLYITNIGNKTAAGRSLSVVFADGSKKTITVDTEASDKLVKNVLYLYNYNFLSKDYTLELITLPTQEDELVEIDAENVLWTSEAEGVSAAPKAELTEEAIAVITIEVVRDQTQTKPSDDSFEFKLTVSDIRFVDLKDLKTSMIENNIYHDDETYTQYTDYRLESETLFYVANFRIMNTAQEIADIFAADDTLQDVFNAILAGQKNLTTK